MYIWVKFCNHILGDSSLVLMFCNSKSHENLGQSGPPTRTKKKKDLEILIFCAYMHQYQIFSITHINMHRCQCEILNYTIYKSPLKSPQICRFLTYCQSCPSCTCKPIDRPSSINFLGLMCARQEMSLFTEITQDCIVWLGYLN